MPDIPVPMRWEGDGFVPATPYWGKQADRQWVVGQVYSVVTVGDRTEKSHRHEFAWLREAWLNLPENLAELYPTPDHLRKRALIAAGFYDEEIVDCGTRAAALRVASSFRKHDDFAAIVVRGPIVVVRSAKSQSRRSMDKETFQASKDAIMEVVSQMIGTTPESLERSAA